MAPVEATATTCRSADAALEACMRLASGPKDEERFLGASLALQHAGRLASDITLRSQLLEALGESFVARLLRGSSAPYRRVGLAIFRALALEGPGAKKLALHCASPLAAAWARGMTPETVEPPVRDGGEEEPHVEESADALEETLEAVEALRQVVRLLRGKPGEAATALGPALEQPFLALAGKVRPVEGADALPVLPPALALVQELASLGFVSSAADALLEAVCLAPALRGSPVRGLALGVLSERIEAGLTDNAQLSEILGEQLAEASAAGLSGGPSGDDDRWRACASTLRLAAAGLHRRGLELFGDTVASLSRLQALLRLAAGEVRLGLEGRAPLEAMCAGCMFAEAATTALVGEAETLEEKGALQASAECLRMLHRIVRDAYDFCLDLPEGHEVPSPLPIVARLIAIWQVEDPVRFSSEFQRSLPVLCRLPPAEFEILLPSVHGLQDWHLTPALGKCLQLLAHALGSDDHDQASELCGSDGRISLLHPCALGLAEVALDAAAYLPEAPLPEAPASALGVDHTRGISIGASAAHIQNANIPRPVLASDPSHQGVQRLCGWSAWLWARGRTASHLNSDDHSVLALLCGSLLTSVPEDALLHCAPQRDMWSVIANFILSASMLEAASDIAASQRLALRLCGFILDRHEAFAHALVCMAAALKKAGRRWLPQALPATLDDEGDEWRAVDDAAVARTCSFLKATVPVFNDGSSDASAYAVATAECLDSMD